MKTKTASKSKKTDKVPKEFWELRLYVAGRTPKSQIALVNLDKICKEHLANQHHLEVIDLLINPELAKEDQILAIPTLVRKQAGTLKRIIGDFTDKERVLVGLGLVPRR